MHFSYSLLLPGLVSMALMFSPVALATHSSTETYDGTVYSFRWLKKPINLSQLSFTDPEGRLVTLPRFKGKTILLNLWASWCRPCIKELPALDRLQQRFGDKDFSVITILLDKDIALAEKIFSDLSISSLTLYRESSEQLGRHMPVDVIPVNVFINSRSQAMGLLRSSFNWDAEESDKLINRLLRGVSANTLRMETQKHLQQNK